VTAVIVIPAAHRAFAEFLIPQTDRIAEGGGNLYLFYAIGHGVARDSTYADLDGRPLVATHAFETLAEADWWVAADIALRGAETRGVQ
jgi:hypothetical protein